ncbi:MAG TPA: SCO family protein [Symbiobacteriaceae bacterium]|nr:SCO family protein [Symbiobacteriaceae bacterium]
MKQARPIPLILKIGIVLALLLMGGAAGGIWYLGRPAPLPDLGTAPTYQLTNQDGQTVKSTDLLGKVQVVGFIWTNCPDICPLVTTEMKTLQVALESKGLAEKGVQLVSISVDPERDTPAVLKEYAKGYGAAFARWQFLTGTLDEVRGTVVTGFHIPMEKAPAGDHSAHGGAADYNVSHSGKIGLVDRAGVIRGWYDGTALDRDRLLADLSSLLR